MAAQIIPFPGKRPATDVLEGEIVSEVPRSAIQASACNRPPRKKPAKRRGAMRVEQLAVVCKRVPRQHADLHSHVGVLTIDWKGKLPYTITFDPSDEDIANIVAPVEGWNRGDEAIAVATDEGTWVFVPLADVAVSEEP